MTAPTLRQLEVMGSAKSEAVELAAALEPRLRAEAQERQKAGKKLPPGNFTGGLGDSRDKVAAAVGVSAPTLAKAKELVEAATERLALAPVVRVIAGAAGKRDRSRSPRREVHADG